MVCLTEPGSCPGLFHFFTSKFVTYLSSISSVPEICLQNIVPVQTLPQSTAADTFLWSTCPWACPHEMLLYFCQNVQLVPVLSLKSFNAVPPPIHPHYFQTKSSQYCQNSELLRKARNLDFYVNSPISFFVYFVITFYTFKKWQNIASSLPPTLGPHFWGHPFTSFFCGLSDIHTYIHTHSRTHTIFFIQMVANLFYVGIKF